MAAGFIVERMCAKSNVISSTLGFLVCFSFLKYCFKNVLEVVQVVKKGNQTCGMKRYYAIK